MAMISKSAKQPMEGMSSAAVIQVCINQLVMQLLVSAQA